MIQFSVTGAYNTMSVVVYFPDYTKQGVILTPCSRQFVSVLTTGPSLGK